MTELHRWRLLADSFPCLTRMMAGKRIPTDYTPDTLIDLYSYGALSTSERSVMGFLLHVWNRYDFSFELPDTQTWDEAHQKAFIAWANGGKLGKPLRYF
jgi:hypothetical protein